MINNNMAFKEETNNNIKKAERRMDAITFEWFVHEPLLLKAFTMFKKVPIKEQHSLGIDCRINPPVIKYNPNFINSLSRERLECVMVQECFKVLLRHPTTRLSKPYNIASLSSSLIVAPMSLGPLLNTEGMEDFYPNPEQYGLPEDGFFENYFRRLMDKQDETNEQIRKIWNSLSKEEKEQLIKDSLEKQQGGNDDKDDSEGEGGAGSGESNDQDPSMDADGFKKFDDSNGAMKEYFDPNSTSNMDWGGNDMMDAEIKEIVRKCKSQANQWGNITGEFIEHIISANTPKINWKEVVRRFSRSVMSRKSYPSRMKYNRRHELEYPGYRREYDTKIIFAIDASGSMSDEDIAEGLAVINATCKHAEITFILFDTKIKKVEKKFKKAKSEFSVLGRGGTDFQCIIDYANDNRADGIVIFTDGWASEPTKPIRGKVLWLLHGKDENMKPPCKWGYVARLNRFEEH